MARIPDEDRGAATKAQVAKRLRVKRRKPLPVPDMEAALRIPGQQLPTPPSPGRRSVVFKQPVGPPPAPHGGHVPIILQKEAPLDVAFPAAPGSARDLKIKAYNQQTEKQRRADARAERLARNARKAAVRKLPPEARQIVGTDKLRHYIQTGETQQHAGLGDVLSKVGGAIVHGPSLIDLTQGAAHAVGNSLESRVNALLNERRRGPTDLAHTVADVGRVGEAAGKGASDLALGPNLTRALAGENYDPKWALAEMALLPIPLKGLPTPLTTILRASIGATKLARAERAGMTVAEVLTRPVSEVRAASRASLAARAADETITGPIPSSRIAGALAGNRQGRIARIIRNDVRATRKFTVGDATMETPADLSRIGKGVRAIMDKTRDSRLVPLRSSETMFARLVGKKAVQHINRAAGLQKALEVALPKRLLHMDWPGIYAVRTVAKGVPIEDAIATTERAVADAAARGDWLGEQANRAHLGFFQAAAKYVTTDAAGNPVFRPDAPKQLEALRSALENVSLERESVLRGLDKLSDETMKGRILNEQLHYADAQMLPTNDWIAARLQEAPIRQQLAEVWTRQNPQEAPNGLAIVDAIARRAYDDKVAEIEGEIARLQGAVERHPTGPLNVRHRRDIEQLQQQLDHLDPALFYSEISKVSDVLPQEIIDHWSQQYGQFGQDWKFSIYDGEDEVRAASRRIADEVVASGLPLPPEWDTPEAVQDGIHQVFRLARDGESGKDWYQDAANGVMRVSEVTGVEPRIVAQLFAIYSQAADTIANSTFVFKAIREFQKYGDLFVGRFPTRQSKEALSVLQGGAWEGRKRSSFYANILRHIPGQEDEYARVIKEMADARGAPILHPVTVDRWVVRMFSDALGDVPGRYYDTFETIMQRMAEHAGLQPEQIQAAAWVAVKQLGFEKEIEKAGGRVKGTLVARLTAGSEDAFQYGIEKNIAEWGAPVKGLEVTPQMKRLANQANKKWGGFTVDRNLKPVAETGYSVSYSLTERAFKLHGLTGEDIAKFRDDYAGLLKDRKNKIGGFSDDINDAGDATEQTLLSVTRHFRNREEALAFAREQGQETIYEYKTGDGIRTGLSREQQRDIILGLDRAHLKGGPVTKLLPLTDEEKAYQDFLDRAAREFGYTKATGRTTPAQRARAEEALRKHADQFPDEPLVQEWYDIAFKQPVDEPSWMLEPPPSAEAAKFQADTADSQLHASLFGADGGTLPGAEAALQGKGADLARQFAGYDEAAAALARQELPMDFIGAVANSPMHIYDKLAIGRHLDQLSGGVLKGREFPNAPAVQRMFPDVITLAGLWEATSRSLYFSAEAHPLDWIHEFTHAMETAGMFPPAVKSKLWAHVGAAPGDKLTHDQSEDVADLVSAVILGFDASKSQLPDDVKSAVLSVQKAMKASSRTFWREHEALAKLPEEERVFLEDIFRFQEDEGVHFTNGFRPKPGQYVPEKLGLPFRFGNPLAPRRAASHWLRLLGGKRVVNLTPTDVHLTHEFKGELLRSGRWEKNVVEGPLEGLLKAYQLQRMADVHEVMVQAGHAVPKSADDVMIPIDPKAWTDKTRAQARSVIEILNTMDTGGKVDKLALDKVDAQAIEAIKDFMFPGLTDSSAARVAEIARQAMAKPIDGVVWVDRNFLAKTGLFQAAPARSPMVKYGISAVDDVNNIMKMMTLSLNPAYYPMNMAGQSIMLGSQLGFSAPFSLARSLAQARRLSEGDLALIDRFADIGYAGALLSKGGALKTATDTVGKVGTILIDKYPRRFSFLHEARRLGYKTDAQIHALVNDVSKFDDLLKVHDRVQRAMVDYGNLNRFEKEYLTRLIFVYPWLRGSSRYAAQFPFDHPVQAALFAGLIYWQQNRIRQAFPEGHPGFMKWYFPVTMPKEGENPYGFRMDQLATPLQTLDLAAMMTYWGTGGRYALPWGSNEESIGSMFGPLAEEIDKTVTGYDSFTRQEVSHGIPQLFARILDPRERWASWDRLNHVLSHQTHEGLYDTTQTQNWLRLFLGSLAPISVDQTRAGDMSAGFGTKTPKQNRDAYLKKIEDIQGAPLSDTERATISQWKANDQAYRKVSREYRADHEIEGDSTIQERAAMLLLTVAEVNPAAADEAKRRAELALTVSDDEAQAAYDELRQALGLTQLSTLDGRMREQQLAARTAVTP